MLPIVYTPKMPLLLLLVLFNTIIYSQNTIGTTLNTTEAYNGYTLFTPTTNTLPSITYLIDNCGQIINDWQSDFRGQGADTILQDGSLFRGSIENLSTLIYAGNNGRIEHFDWDGTLIWGFTYSDTDFSFHHDYAVLPNGNVLMLVAERMTTEEAIQAGRNPNNIVENELYTEKIIEFQPNGIDDAIIIWEWDLWDHIVQDFDATKNNFGVISENPQLLNINFLGFSQGNADWVHTNSLDYNAELDQILLSSRFLSEVYVIDHSTTTSQAQTNTGGNSNKGGDFLYRWGNPQVYDRGSEDDRRLFGQHTAQWSADDESETGRILVFNNGLDRGFSSVDEIDIPTPDENGNYPIINTEPYEPIDTETLYPTLSETASFFSPFISSAFKLPNNNILIDEGPFGRLFEVGENDEVVWRYLNPVLNTGGILSQGESHNPIDSRIFRTIRYSLDYAGFEGRDLTPGLPIELNPILENCELLSLPESNSIEKVSLYPNPASNLVTIKSESPIVDIQLYNLQGQLVLSYYAYTALDISALPSGIYLFQIETLAGISTKKLIKD